MEDFLQELKRDVGLQIMVVKNLSVIFQKKCEMIMEHSGAVKFSKQ